MFVSRISSTYFFPNYLGELIGAQFIYAGKDTA